MLPIQYVGSLIKSLPDEILNDIFSLITNQSFQSLKDIHNLRSIDKAMYNHPRLKMASLIPGQQAALHHLGLTLFMDLLVEFCQETHLKFKETHSIESLVPLTEEKIADLHSFDTLSSPGFAIDFNTPYMVFVKLKASVVEQAMLLRECELRPSANHLDLFTSVSHRHYLSNYKMRLKLMDEGEAFIDTIPNAIWDQHSNYTKIYDWDKWETYEHKMQHLHMAAALFTSQPEIMKQYVKERFSVTKPIFKKFQQNKALCTLL